MVDCWEEGIGAPPSMRFLITFRGRYSSSCRVRMYFRSSTSCSENSLYPPVGTAKVDQTPALQVADLAHREGRKVRPQAIHNLTYGVGVFSGPVTKSLFFFPKLLLEPFSFVDLDFDLRLIRRRGFWPGFRPKLIVYVIFLVIHGIPILHLRSLSSFLFGVSARSSFRAAIYVTTNLKRYFPICISSPFRRSTVSTRTRLTYVPFRLPASRILYPCPPR